MTYSSIGPDGYFCVTGSTAYVLRQLDLRDHALSAGRKCLDLDGDGRCVTCGSELAAESAVEPGPALPTADQDGDG